eukprot:936051-Rhodomonas_salina.1
MHRARACQFISHRFPPQKRASCLFVVIVSRQKHDLDCLDLPAPVLGVHRIRLIAVRLLPVGPVGAYCQRLVAEARKSIPEHQPSYQDHALSLHTQRIRTQRRIPASLTSGMLQTPPPHPREPGSRRTQVNTRECSANIRFNYGACCCYLELFRIEDAGKPRSLDLASFFPPSRSAQPTIRSRHLIAKRARQLQGC